MVGGATMQKVGQVFLTPWLYTFLHPAASVKLADPFDRDALHLQWLPCRLSGKLTTHRMGLEDPSCALCFFQISSPS